MKSLFVTLVATAGLLLMPMAAYTETSSGASAPATAPAAPQGAPGSAQKGTPPVAQPLVREGDFAMELVGALKIGTAKNEVEAESMLTSVGIAPQNGWIADYPVTPRVLGDLQKAVVAAADSKKLPMGKDEALKAMQTVSREFGISFAMGGPGQSGKEAGANGATVGNYFDEYGPPVVTYYPPPWDYDYLYAWVPYPFWCDAFFFPGFFILNDFDVIVVGHGHGFHHHRGEVTNHIFDRKTDRYGRMDAVTRTGKFFGEGGLHKGFASAEARKGASAIFERGMERAHVSQGTASAISRMPGERHFTSPRGGREFRIPANRNPGSFAGRGTFSSPAPSRASHGGFFDGFHGGGFGGFHGGGFGGGFGGFHGGGGGRR